MIEAYLYKKLNNKKVKCQNCAHYCQLMPGQRGLCGVRENINGKLFALNYEKIAVINIDPIEKKPFFHFLPGSQSLSIATVGCNFFCKNCQNYDLSQSPKPNRLVLGEKISPKEIVKIALKNKLPSISYTYVEPTIFLELALETMKLARQAGLKNNWVSNGFFSLKARELVVPYLDAINIDIKGFSDRFYQKICGARLKPILDNCQAMKKAGVWLEITTLAIPTLSDSKKIFKDIAQFIKKKLGTETPWHISQFCGGISWQLQHLPDTPVKTLEIAYQIGKETGLKYVYTGNVPGLNSEDTFCPKCNNLIIDRFGYQIMRYDKNGYCPKCNKKLDLII